MTYRPPVKKSDFDGPKGIAKVFLNGNKTKAKIVFASSGDECIININNCPDEVKEYIRSGEFFVKMNQEKDKLYSMYPANGMYQFKVAKFSSRKDQPPAPMTKISKNKNWPPYLYFVAMLKIVAGDYKDMQVPLFLHYNFEEAQQEIKGEMKSVVTYSKRLDKSDPTAFLDEFLAITGAWDFGPITPYVDNVLPKLEQRILRKGKEFPGVIKDGYIDTLYQQSSLPTETKLPEETEFTEGAEFDADDLADDPLEEKFE